MGCAPLRPSQSIEAGHCTLGEYLKVYRDSQFLTLCCAGGYCRGLGAFMACFPINCGCGECPRNCPENNWPERGNAFRIPCQLPRRNPTFRADQSCTLELELSHQSSSKQLTSLATRPSSATIIRFSQQTPRLPHMNSSNSTKPVSFQYISLFNQSSMLPPPTK